MSARLAITIVNHPSEMERVMTATENFGRENRLSPNILYALHLALEELLVNTISYGYDDQAKHSIHIGIEVLDGEVLLKIEDDARPFNPLEAPEPDVTKPLEERPIGGLGIHLVRKTMDEIRYERRDRKNFLVMKKKLA